jgi:hypothetical protein
MTDATCSSSSKRSGLVVIVRSRFARVRSLCQLALLLLSLSSIVACGLKSERRGLPPEVETVVGTVTDDIAAERYEKIYNEAADLWKQELTLDETVTVFKTLREKLGKMENRSLHSAAEQNNSGGPLKGNVFIVTYQSRFERGDGMETFTLVQREHEWQLARYFVNSTALK